MPTRRVGTALAVRDSAPEDQVATHPRASHRRRPNPSGVCTLARTGYPSPPEVLSVPEPPTGALVRLYRVQRRRGTVSLATHTGITVRYLEMIEAGTKTPSLPVLRRLVKVLGVRTSALVSEATPSESHERTMNRRGPRSSVRSLRTARLALTKQETAELLGPARTALLLSSGNESDYQRPDHRSAGGGDLEGNRDRDLRMQPHGHLVGTRGLDRPAQVNRPLLQRGATR